MVTATSIALAMLLLASATGAQIDETTADAPIDAPAPAAPLTKPSELRSQPRYISGEMPEDQSIIRAAVADGRWGSVVVSATVSISGTLSDLSLANPTGDPAIDAAVIAAMQSWKLRPARDKAGQVVAVEAKFPFAFGGVPNRLVGSVPVYPDDAKALGHNGKVIATATIDATGQLTAPRIKESSQSELLDGSVLTALSAWRFPPPKDLAGRDGPRDIMLTFEFNQASGGGDNYLAGIKNYRCATFINELDWWIAAHPDLPVKKYQLYSFIGGLQLIVPELLGPPLPRGAPISANFTRHEPQWDKAVERCRVAPESTFLAEYRKG